MQTGELNQKVELWGMIDTTNEIGELDRTAEKIKDLWVKIIPKHGSQSNVADIVENVVLNVIVRCRRLSVKNPSIDMYFMHKSLKYKVIDFIEDMKNKDFIEFNCKIIYE